MPEADKQFLNLSIPWVEPVTIATLPARSIPSGVGATDDWVIPMALKVDKKGLKVTQWQVWSCMGGGRRRKDRSLPKY